MYRGAKRARRAARRSAHSCSVKVHRRWLRLESLPISPQAPSIARALHCGWSILMSRDLHRSIACSPASRGGVLVLCRMECNRRVGGKQQLDSQLISRAGDI